MSLRIHPRDAEIRFVTKFGENRPLRSWRKVLWIAIHKKLALPGTRPNPHFAQNGPIAQKNPWTLSPLDIFMYTGFGPDRLRLIAGLITERLIFRHKKSIQYRLSAYNDYIMKQLKLYESAHKSPFSQRQSIKSNIIGKTSLDSRIETAPVHVVRLRGQFHHHQCTPKMVIKQQILMFKLP